MEGRYSTPLLFHLWYAWIAKIDMRVAEAKVLQPIAFAKSELNKGKNTCAYGFRGDGAISDNLRSALPDLAVMVPEEWKFSHFEEGVKRGEIDCDGLEPFNTHMQKYWDLIEAEGGKPFKQTTAAEETPKPSESEFTTPKKGGKRTRKKSAKPTPMATFSKAVAKSFVFVEPEVQIVTANGSPEAGGKAKTKNGDNQEKLPRLNAEAIPEVFQMYFSAGAVKSVQLDVEKMIAYHEKQKPGDCANAIASYWKEYEVATEKQKDLKKQEKKRKTPEGSRTSDRLSDKKSK